MNVIILTFMNFSIMYYWIKRILYAQDPKLELINLGLFIGIMLLGINMFSIMLKNIVNLQVALNENLVLNSSEAFRFEIKDLVHVCISSIIIILFMTIRKFYVRRK